MHGILVADASGNILVSNNCIRAGNGYAITAGTRVTGANVVLDDNAIDTTSAPNYAVLLEGVNLAKLTGNTINAPIVYRCLTAGSVPTGALTTDSTIYGIATDTG